LFNAVGKPKKNTVVGILVCYVYFIESLQLDLIIENIKNAIARGKESVVFDSIQQVAAVVRGNRMAMKFPGLETSRVDDDDDDQLFNVTHFPLCDLYEMGVKLEIGQQNLNMTYVAVCRAFALQYGMKLECYRLEVPSANEDSAKKMVGKQIRAEYKQKSGKEMCTNTMKQQLSRGRIVEVILFYFLLLMFNNRNFVKLSAVTFSTFRIFSGLRSINYRLQMSNNY